MVRVNLNNVFTGVTLRSTGVTSKFRQSVQPAHPTIENQRSLEILPDIEDNEPLMSNVYG